MQCCPGERRHDFVTGGHWLAGIAARYDRIAHLASSGSISSSGGGAPCQLRCVPGAHEAVVGPLARPLASRCSLDRTTRTPLPTAKIFFPRRARLRDLVFLFARALNDVQESAPCCTSKIPGVVPAACKRLHYTVIRQSHVAGQTQWQRGSWGDRSETRVATAACPATRLSQRATAARDCRGHNHATWHGDVTATNPDRRPTASHQLAKATRRRSGN